MYICCALFGLDNKLYKMHGMFMLGTNFALFMFRFYSAQLLCIALCMLLGFQHLYIDANYVIHSVSNVSYSRHPFWGELFRVGFVLF
jgi:hypothetical protein